MENNIKWLSILAQLLAEKLKMKLDAATLENDGNATYVCLWKGRPTYVKALRAWVPSRDGVALGRIRTDALLNSDIGEIIPEDSYQDIIVDLAKEREAKAERFRTALANVRKAYEDAGIPFAADAVAGNIDPQDDDSVQQLFFACRGHLCHHYLKRCRYDRITLEFSIRQEETE